MKSLAKTKKVIIEETRGHSFGNGWVYVEKYRNNILLDCYFVKDQDMFSNGDVKIGGHQYFYSPYEIGPEKEVEKINYVKFNKFEDLYYYDKGGRVFNVYDEEVGEELFS